MLIVMMRPAGTGLALARGHARAVPAVRDDVPERLLPPRADPNSITSEQKHVLTLGGYVFTQR
ncbi:MAG: hypothetical protein ACRDOD_00210 [Streptosporangiaceae bacterium]